VSDGINYCVRYGVKVVGGKDGDDRNFMPADEVIGLHLTSD